MNTKEMLICLTVEEIKDIMSKIGEACVKAYKNKRKAAKLLTMRKYHDFLVEYQKTYENIKNRILESEMIRLGEIEGPDQPISSKVENKALSKIFYDRMTVTEEDNTTITRIDLTGKAHELLVRNMKDFFFCEYLKRITFTDVVKIVYNLDDGSTRFEYVDYSDLKYYYTKFSDENWDKETKELAPEYGSDKLLLQIDIRRVHFIGFIKWKPANDQKSYNTRGGSFFPYLVKSKRVDLTKYQIIPELNRETVKIIDEHCLVYAVVYILETRRPLLNVTEIREK